MVKRERTILLDDTANPVSCFFLPFTSLDDLIREPFFSLMSSSEG